jgi:hypothetical protein
LYKKGSVYAAGNYRGVHLTAQLSKAMERLLGVLFTPFLTKNVSYGPNQFAYMTGRGARDALAYMVLVWVQALALGRKVAVYCSDVSGAFDRVRVRRLLEKLKAKNLHPDMIAVVESWLRDRRAHVVVGGQKSDGFTLKDMVFQGTVWGPSLWNTFYEDARRAIKEWFFKEIVYADDLNAYRIFTSTTPNTNVVKAMESCQGELHLWGRANQVTFDPSKESQHILSIGEPWGNEFKILGVLFDAGLSMESAVQEVVVEAGWKLRMLIRTRRFYTDAELVLLYKAHLLSYLEYRTAAIYHARREVLDKLDRVQSKFLSDLGIPEVTALLEFNLAPLAARRDMAMLGLVHRTILGKGPAHFREFFKTRPDRKLIEPSCRMGGLSKRSALGLIPVYNLLPNGITSAVDVPTFQRRLQLELSLRAEAGMDHWQTTYSPRLPLDRHPLLLDGSASLLKKELDAFLDSD